MPVRPEYGKALPIKIDKIKLKQEFMEGPWTTIVDFFRFKGIVTDEPNRSLHTRGWSREKQAILAAKAIVPAKKKDLVMELAHLEETRLRQAKVARFLQKLGENELKKEGKEIDAEVARKLIISGMEQERIALGMDKPGQPGSLTQINVTLPKTRLDDVLEKMNYEQLIEFAAELKRYRKPLPGGSGASVSEGTIVSPAEAPK